MSLYWIVSMVEGGQEKNVTWWAFEILSKKNYCYFFLFTENTLFSHIIYPDYRKVTRNRYKRRDPLVQAHSWGPWKDHSGSIYGKDV